MLFVGFTRFLGNFCVQEFANGQQPRESEGISVS